VFFLVCDVFFVRREGDVGPLVVVVVVVVFEVWDKVLDVILVVEFGLLGALLLFASSSVVRASVVTVVVGVTKALLHLDFPLVVGPVSFEDVLPVIYLEVSAAQASDLADLLHFLLHLFNLELPQPRQI
jgi:hypothetical protein